MAAAAVVGAFGTPVSYSIGPVLLAFGCAFATGLIFGYMPARKAALEGAAAGVRVNAGAPGPVQTKMLDRFVGNDEAAKSGFLSTSPARRAADPEEIAQTVVFLAGDKARYLTGQSIAVDGGYTAQ